MKKPLAVAILSGLLFLVPAPGATLAVSAGVTTAGSLYNYTYTFSISGTGLNLDNIFLGSDDLSPLNVAFTFDNASTTNWSWLSNNTPQNYIDFLNTAGGTLGSADTLKVTFSSFLAPATSQFVVGDNSVTGDVSNRVSSVLAPTAAAATPEPTSVCMLLLGIGAVSFLAARRRTA